MGIENNEKDINRSGSEEQKNTPKKKLNIVFRKQNSSSIKELPKSLRSAAGENDGRTSRGSAAGQTKKQGQAEKSRSSGENTGRKTRPLPAGTKPVRPALKDMTDETVVKRTETAAEKTELKTAAAESRAAESAAVQPQTEVMDSVKTNVQENDNISVKDSGRDSAADSMKTAAGSTDALAKADLPGSTEAPKTEQAQKQSAEVSEESMKEKKEAKASAANSASEESPAENTAASEKKPQEQPSEEKTAAKQEKGESQRTLLGGISDTIPKVKIVKSYANYNAAAVIAEASRQARQANAARNSEERKNRQDGRRNDGRQGARTQSQNGQSQIKPKQGDGNGRTYIVRGNAAGAGQGGGRGRFGSDSQGQQSGSGRPAGRAAAPAFDGPSGKNTGRNGRGNSLHNDRKDKKDKFIDSPTLRTPKTGKGAFIKPEPKKDRPEDEVKLIVIPEKLTIKELSEKLRMQPSVIVKKLFLEGKMVTPNTELTYEEAEEIAIEYEVLCEKEVQEDVIAELLKEEEESEDSLKPRNPVVCVMGHVDHGKTSLLDAIRNTNVTSREAGGITQHIGASVVRIGDRNITFLDTPGHEAFTAMRLRGAQSTDIAVLVVAADDGVKPQTIEAINHAKAAGVEVIVAINKIDKVGANIDHVKSELTEYELIAEDYGGSTPMVPISAKTGEGITDLLEMIILQADVMELKANPDRNARGLVIEAQLDKGRGPVATVLVQKGTLHVGDNVAAGACYGKVRAMLDDKGNRIKKAGPSYPAEILGLNDVPNAGEVFMVCSDEKEARAIAETFIAEQKKHMLEETKQKMNLDDLFDEIKAGNVKELPIIVKADVQGSVEAVKQSLGKLSNEEVAVKVIHAAVGNINESDVTLASTANAIIIGFNVKPDATAKSTAEHEKVDMRLYRVIYQAIEDLQAALTGMLAPVYEEKYTGRAIVRQVFKASDVGRIAGSYVTDGVIERGSKARLYRGDKKLFDGDIASLKRFKDEVKEVKLGFECGIVLEDFTDIEVDDTLEIYKMVQVPRSGAAE